MSRSRKKVPIIGYSCKTSEKLDKIFAHKRFRRKCKQLLKINKELLYKMQEVSENWTFQKDGKHDLRNSKFIDPEMKDELIKQAYRK